MLDLEKYNKICNSMPGTLNKEEVYEVGMQLAGDLKYRRQLELYIKNFSHLLEPEEVGDMWRETAVKERDWYEENKELIKKKNEETYNRVVVQKENPNLPVTHSFNRRANLAKGIENTKVSVIKKAFEAAKRDCKEGKIITEIDRSNGNLGPIPMAINGGVRIRTDGKVTTVDNLKQTVVKTRDKAVSESEKRRKIKKSSDYNSKISNSRVNNFDDDEYYYDSEEE